MKQILFFSVVLIMAIACSSTRNTVKINSVDEDAAAADTVEYELETFDARFETWYALHDQPSKYRSEQYYESWNHKYVNAWNFNATRPGNRFFETIVGYDPTVDYNFELDHKLFYYFQYVENELGIQIMPGGPQSIVF
ncbi:MAG: DUF6146 family protein [Mariniphaga sp.]